MQSFELFFSKTTEQNSWILHTNSPLLCVIKVCSNGGGAYINSKLIAKANLNIAIVMLATFENLIFQNCSTEFYDIAHTHMVLGYV